MSPTLLTRLVERCRKKTPPRPSPRRNTCILDKGLVPYSMSRFFGSPTDLKSSSIWYDATPFFWTR